ncbi:MAG: hypothetical protein ACTSWK_07425 [Promethearchaeota archaeon]
MTNNKNVKWALFISLIFLVGFTTGSINASAHDPRFIDMKYYPQDQILSVYIIHGVSDSEYHYIEKVTIEFIELPESLIENFTTDPDYLLEADSSADQEAEEGLFGKYWIREADVFDAVDVSTLNRTLMIEEHYTNQTNDLVSHFNYTIEAPEWTLIVVTAVCSLGGSYTYSLISGHPWYDNEHHIIDMVVPTIVCSIIVMIPLALWRIFGKKKKEEVKH